jgi:bla regulator protein blaR1
MARSVCWVIAGLGLTVLGLSSTLHGRQAPATTAGPAFEVASIRPSPRAEPNRFGFPTRSTFRIEPGGRITATQITLRDLVWRAYEVQPFQIDGGPAWVSEDRFDVAAKAEDGFAGSSADIASMLRVLLTERFKLVVRTESKEMPVFALVVTRRDGRLGDQLRQSTIDCAAVRARRKPGVAPTDAAERACELSMRLSGPTMTMRFEGETMNGIARLLTGPETQRVVVNKTGVAGTFDGELAFTPTPLPGFPPLPGSDAGTTMFTALQEQFGLKLQPERGPVPIVTIVSAEKPME